MPAPRQTVHPSAPRSRSTSPAALPPPPTISARWLLFAFAGTLVLAALCGYGALCLLFYQGQWQMLFHPSRVINATPATENVPFSQIHFDVTDTGLPRLEGWWIPAAAPPGPAAPVPHATMLPAASVVLYLHDARGSLSDCVPALTRLHSLGVNVFSFDYSGFGHSTGAHPTERLATADSVAAWNWLTTSRHIPPRSIVVYGDGTGATFAAYLGLRFHPAGAVLEDPNPPARVVFAADARARILPMWLLQKEYLDPSSDLANAHIPRLFLVRRQPPTFTLSLFALSSGPKQYEDLRSASETAVIESLRRFLAAVLR